MHAYKIALEIEPVTMGRTYVALPLHCTLVHWFRSDVSPAEVAKAITPIITATAPVELVSGPEDLFGLDKDVPVNTLLNTEKLMALHNELRSALGPLEITDINPDWVGDGFTMHVTRQRSGRFEEGRRFMARKVFICEAELPEELQQKNITTKLVLKGQ